MKIIILGAGQVGASVAANLASEANDITVVDDNPGVLQELQDRLDIRRVVGHASYPETLAQAGADDADMILAVTNSDETNMVACQVASTRSTHRPRSPACDLKVFSIIRSCSAPMLCRSMCASVRNSWSPSTSCA